MIETITLEFNSQWKHQFVVGVFFDTIDEPFNLASLGWGNLDYRKLIKISIQKASKDMRFFVETQVGKIMTRRENSLLSRSHSEFYWVLLWLHSPRSHPPSCSRRRSIYTQLLSWGSWNDDEIDVTVVIFMCEIVITTAIVGAWLLGLPAQNSLPSITAQDVMIVGEVSLCNWRRESRRAASVVVLLEAKVSGKEWISRRLESWGWLLLVNEKPAW